MLKVADWKPFYYKINKISLIKRNELAAHAIWIKNCTWNKPSKTMEMWKYGNCRPHAFHDWFLLCIIHLSCSLVQHISDIENEIENTTKTIVRNILNACVEFSVKPAGWINKEIAGMNIFKEFPTKNFTKKIGGRLVLLQCCKWMMKKKI